MQLLKRIQTRLSYVVRMLWLVRDVNRLQISHSGVDDQGHAWVRLMDGKIFYGFVTKPGLRRYYAQVRAPVKDVLCLAAFQVALDIVIRYYGGALAVGGPLKQRAYRVTEGDTVVEMGAYLGHYSMRLAEQVSDSGRVIAIEANPNNQSILEKNIRDNSLDQVLIVNKGVWNARDTMTFSIRCGDQQSTSIILSRGSEEVVDIPVDTLDRILEDSATCDIALMIIQLNGAEAEALQGLTRQRPGHLAIAARYSVDGIPTSERVIRMLRDRGYSTSTIGREYIYAQRM